MEIRKNDLITVEIESLTYGGRGLGRLEGLAVFVPMTAPGDIVQAVVRRKKPSYIEAELAEVTSPSPARVQPRCPHFGICGGCSWQHVPYEEQLRQKEAIVRSTLEHVGGIEGFQCRPVIASPRQWRYRNKVDYTFGTDPGGKAILGFHLPGSYQDILNIETCLIQPEPFDGLLDEMRLFAREHDLSSHNPKTHRGLLRHFMIRCAEKTGADGTQPILATLVTSEPDLPRRDELLARLRERCPSLAGFIHGINRAMSDVFRIEQTGFSWGADHLVEGVGPLRLKISPLSFFQTNSLVAELLYGKAKEYLSLTGREALFDAYCGAGAIGLFCADRAGSVYGIELLREAIWDARHNAAMNGITNSLFMAGEMRSTLPILLGRVTGGFQRVVVDPPRTGMDKKSLRQIAHIGAPVAVYVSCNPATMARDMQFFHEAGYTLTEVQPVDMFPHTYHVEAVGKMVMG